MTVARPQASAVTSGQTSAANPSTPLQVSTDVSQPEWDAFLERHGGTVEHLWAWRHVFTDVFRHECAYLAARRGSTIVGVLPLAFVKSLIFGRSVVSLPFANYAGLVSTDNEAAAALAGCARDLGGAFGAEVVELRNIERRLPELPCRTHKVGSRLTLPSSSEELFKGLDRKVRNQIRKAQKDGVVVEQGGSALIDEFYAIFARNMRDLGTPVFPKALFTETLRLLPHIARVFVARHNRTPIAGGLALAWNRTVLVPWASSLREHRQLNGNMLLYWTMLEFAIARGCLVFDFGRSTPDVGTHRFKQQWGAADFPLHWEYIVLTAREVPDHGTSNARMRLFIEAWKRLPVPLATAVGPVITRHIC